MHNIPALLCFASLVLFDLPYSRCYEVGKCYGFKEMDDNLNGKTFVYKPHVKQYQYVGVKANTDVDFSPCVRDDVTRIKTPYVFLDKEASDATTNQNQLSWLEKKLKDAISLSGENKKSYHDAVVKFDKVDAGKTTFSIEFTIKGHEDNPPGDVRDILQQASQSLIKDLGETDVNEFDLKVLTCEGPPPRPPTFGKYDWPTGRYKGHPGQFATYSCEDKYVVEDVNFAYSICSHDDLKWSDPLQNNTCKKGCADEPPIAPKLSRRLWKVNKNKENDVTMYSCIPDFRPINGEDGYSTCVDSKWTNLQKDFGCEQILCPKQVPWNTDHGVVSDFDPFRPLIVGTKIRYSCKNGFCSNYDEDIEVECSQYGNWTALPHNFGCYPKVRTYCLTNRMQQMLEKEYLAARDRAPITDFFVTATIPCIIGMALFLLCAMAVVRLDSPLYWCCSEKVKKQSYRVDQY